MAPTNTGRDPGKQFAGRPPGGCSGYAGAIALDRPPGVFPDVTHDPNAPPPEAPMEGAPDPEGLADGTTYAEVVNGAIYYWEVTDGAYELTYIDTDCCKMPEVIDSSDVLAAASEAAGDEVTALTPAAISAFIAENFPDAPAGQDFLIGGDDPLVDPDFVFTANGDGTAHCVKAPVLEPIEISEADILATTGEVEVTPELIDAYLAENFPDAAPGQRFLIGGTRTAPNRVYEANGDGTAHCSKDNTGCVSNVKSLRCVNRVVEVEDCEGNLNFFRSNRVCRTIGFTAGDFVPVDETVANGFINSAENCTTVQAGPCDQNATIETYQSYRVELQDPTWQGSITFRPYKSIDGGATWSPIATGGVDSLQINGPVNSEFAELSFWDKCHVTVPAGGTDICLRYQVERNNTVSGTVVVTQLGSQGQVETDEMVHCAFEDAA